MPKYTKAAQAPAAAIVLEGLRLGVVNGSRPLQFRFSGNPIRPVDPLTT